MEEPNYFFSPTREKAYITCGFVGLRFLLGYLNHFQVPAKAPFFVNMVLTSLDFVVSLPMKLVFVTGFLKGLLKYEIGALLLFVIMIVYWYLFACILMYAYELLNKKDVEEKSKHAEHKE